MKSAVLWGVIGSLSFLVLVAAYALLVDPLVTILQGAVAAVLVGAAVAVAAYALEHRLASWAARRADE